MSSSSRKTTDVLHEARTTHLVPVVCSLGIALTSASAFAFSFELGDPVPFLVGHAPPLAALLGAQTLNRQGRSGVASLLVVATFFVIAMAAGWFLGGLHGPAPALFVVAILLAGMLLRAENALLVVLGSAVACFGLALCAVDGLLPTTPRTYGPPTLVIVNTLVFVLVGGLIHLAMTAMTDAVVTGDATRLELESTIRQLRQTTVSKEYIDRIVASIGDMLVVVDGWGVIRRSNDAALRSMCDLQGRLLGRKLIDIIDPPPPTLIGEALIQHAGDLITASGGRIPIVLTMTPIQTRAGQGAVVVVHDVSTHRRLQERLERAVAAAEEGSRAKSQFLASMSHQLRTPLNAILGTAELLISESTSPHVQNDARLILDAGQSLLTEVERVLDLSQLEAGRVALDVRDVQLPALLLDAASAMRPLIQQHGNRFSVRIPQGLPRARADAARLRQVVTHLLSNAGTYTEGGDVVLSASAVDGNLVVEIRDNGVGMAPDQLARAFQPFARGDASSSRRQQGAGVGLTIGQRLIHLMGGELEAESRIGAGSTFRVVLPRATSTSRPPPLEALQTSP